MSEAIHKQIDIKAGPNAVYNTLLDSKVFGDFSGAPADIVPQAGGAFSCFGGLITGRIVELVPNQRIVQAWRFKLWPEGTYSIVLFELQPNGSGTRLSLTHDAFPPEMRAHLNGEMPDGGWDRMYLNPLRKHLS